MLCMGMILLWILALVTATSADGEAWNCHYELEFRPVRKWVFVFLC